jgi:ATP-dependent RNA helicase DeaD
MPSFNDYSLQPATRAVLANMDIIEPSPIQAQAIPALLAGNDLVGQSATGSGKTLAYGIPLVERLAREKRFVQALVLVPTRELAVQVNTVLSKLATSRRLTTALLVGGRPYANQISSLRYGAQIVVGTPGRVKDHLERGTLVLNQLRICVLDEADQMLDIGFAQIIEEILTTTPDTRQMALFSATMPDWIVKLQEKFLKNPVKIDITAADGGESTIEQIAYQVPHDQKMAALCTLLYTTQGESSLIFGKTKYGVEKLGKQLSRFGFAVGTLHGDKSQRARDEILTKFRNGQVHTLLATNVAARGLDIKGIYQVINYELPESSELFTHRIGRTGRMGQQGKAITLLAPSDLSKWRRMASSLGQAVTLKRLIIDEDAMVARPEEPVTEQEQSRDQRPGRERRDYSSNRDREPRPFRERRDYSSGQSRDQRRKEIAVDQEQEVRRESKEFMLDQEPRPARERREYPNNQDRVQRQARERRERSFDPELDQRPVREHREILDQDREQRPARSRRDFSAGQERSRVARPNNDSYPASSGRGRQATSVAPVRQSEGLSERPYPGGKPRGDARRGAERPASVGRTPGEYNTSKFESGEQSQPRGPRRNPKPGQAGRPRRVVNRSASR